MASVRLPLLTRPFTVLFAVCALSCGSRHSSETPEPGSIDSESISPPLETPHSSGNQRTLSNATIPNDSSLYVGDIHTLLETGELYTPVYFRSGIDTGGRYDQLSKQTDSIIYEDAEQRRERLPFHVAIRYFNLSGLDTISVYKRAQLTGKAKFVRVEHFSDAIEDQFIAVFKPVGRLPLHDSLDYCTAGKPTHLQKTDISYRRIEDEQLTKAILQRLLQASAKVRTQIHVQIKPSDAIYSAISMQSRLLLVETKEGDSNILKDLHEDWFISELTPLHLEVNGKPVLLLNMGKNETDVTWTSVAIFAGEQYILPDDNRIIVDVSEDEAAQSDCPFNDDYRQLTTEWLKEVGVDNFTWDPDKKQAVIVQAKDTIFASRGGCEHFSMTAGRIYAFDNHTLDDSIHWTRESLKLAQQFSFEFYTNEIRSGRLKFTRNENRSSWLEFGDDDLDDNKYYVGIEVEARKNSKVVTVSAYYN